VPLNTQILRHSNKPKSLKNTVSSSGKLVGGLGKVAGSPDPLQTGNTSPYLYINLRKTSKLSVPKNDGSLVKKTQKILEKKFHIFSKYRKILENARKWPKVSFKLDSGLHVQS